MFRPRRGFCQNWAWFILSSTLYGSWILGLFPFIFNCRKKQLSLSRCLRLYGLILNFFLLFILIYISFETEKPSKLEAFERNPLLEKINILIGIMSVISAIVVHLMNFLRSNQILRIINELLALEYRHFGAMNLWNCPKLNCFVIQKSVTIIAVMLTLMGVHHAMPGNITNFWTSLLMCLTQVGLNLKVLHCYLGVLFIYRNVWLINGQLLELVHQSIPMTDLISARIRELLSIYRHLLELNKKLQTAYELHMTLILLSGFAGNIVVVFFLIVFEFSMNKPSIFLVVFIHSLLLNIWDFWLSIVVCDLTEKTGQETSAILKLFCNEENLDVELERNINEFAWLCSHAKFRFRLFGMFSVNYNMGFNTIITSFLYLLYLVQFDFKNL
ncbi:putative gustatory receptor 22b [Drosophila serrata]|uniref:putative gustatory receptor 22b n=1 Tax=Drosophila serrata TaxID=7274 RepID=UPI000A1CF56A|nr:putative gustatory receptor 22b [Drosophila serrata]